MSDRRGIALVMTLAGAVLIGSFTLLALHAALIRSRLVSDSRRGIEGALVTASALAAVRIGYRAELDTLVDGAVLPFPAALRSDGWSLVARAERVGVVIRVDVSAVLRASDGSTHAAHHASLLLARDAADTVRVLARGARF